MSNGNVSDLVSRLRKRAEIRRQIPTRKSVQDGAPDRIASLLDEAADALGRLPDREWYLKTMRLVHEFAAVERRRGREGRAPSDHEPELDALEDHLLSIVSDGVPEVPHG